ncbi:potassium translocating ATPase, subunit C [Luteimonas sp. 9C]|uniref:potassium-transporting ATPase subunit KdpC n=1 Tax=Luteimonas sp. 9C TaxID=2653148 RepID=UPI0012F1D038|nr:potassium-transporting ATPase subunit KdpC [Luteimonas sp. 9C]VXB64187.1 potassium translocating ATPase, subunit C [Luteimonas sp. 9C]
MSTPSSSRSLSTPRGLLRAASGLAAVALLGFGLLYSLAATALGGALFPAQSRGSLVEREGRIVGSALVAQPFVDARYFRSRPSAAGYDPMALAGSNQARSNPALRATIAADIDACAAREGIEARDVPGDLVTRSGSGIDPHISPDAARVQIARIARTRGLAIADVERLVEAHTAAPQFGLLGAPRVDVLALNLALDAQAGGRGAE